MFAEILNPEGKQELRGPGRHPEWGRGGTALGEGTEFTECVPGFGWEGDTSLMGGKCLLNGIVSLKPMRGLNLHDLLSHTYTPC